MGQASRHQPQRMHWEWEVVSISSSARNSTEEVVLVTGISRLETAKPIIGPPMTILDSSGVTPPRYSTMSLTLVPTLTSRLAGRLIPLPEMVITFSYRGLESTTAS